MMDTRDGMNGMVGMDSLKWLSDNWWLLLVQGIASIILGILILVWPGRTLALLILFFGLLTLINGAIAIVSAIGAAADGKPWGWRFAAGIFGLLAGLIIVRWPGETALIVLLFVGVWAIMSGLVQIIGSVADHAEIRHAWLLALEGVVSILFGIAMLAWPGVGLLTLALLVGIYALVHGILFTVMAFRVRSLGQRLPAGTGIPSRGTPAY